MLNPFTTKINIFEDESHIPIYSKSKQKQENRSTYLYIIIGIMYSMNICAIIIGSLNHSHTYEIENWLIISGIYNILGLFIIYQFNLQKYENKSYLISYEIIKNMWFIIGLIILFGYNKIQNNIFILNFTLCYIIIEIIWMSYNLNKIVNLQKNILLY